MLGRLDKLAGNAFIDQSDALLDAQKRNKATKPRPL
jgi:hypothetical protein